MKQLAVMAMSVWLCVLAAGCGPGEQDGKTRVAVIPKGTTHVYWKSVHAGAVKAAREVDVEIIWQGPLKEDDRRMQIDVVQNFISRQVDGIVLAPLDEQALVRPVQTAVAQGIPVVIIDSSLRADVETSFVATDNYRGGKMAAERLAEVMGDGGRVIMLRYQEGSASTTKREQGFLNGIKEYAPTVELISTNQYGGATAESAFQASQNLLTRFSDVDGIFCPNESTTFGMLRALKTAGKAGRVPFVGFDSSEPLVQALRNKEIDGLVVQNPLRMGYLGVKTLVRALRGEKVESRIDTGATVVTPENMDRPDIQQLISPDLDTWLDE